MGGGDVEIVIVGAAFAALKGSTVVNVLLFRERLTVGICVAASFASPMAAPTAEPMDGVDDCLS